MPKLKSLLRPEKYGTFLRRLANGNHEQMDEANQRALLAFPPGHFYSPLLDVRTLREVEPVPFDGAEMWENIDMRRNEQETLYSELLANHPPYKFPQNKTEEFRFYLNNPFFSEADAYTLSAVLRRQRPRRIIEVGSGFSSAVMLDTLQKTQHTADLTFIEPYPERLYSLLEGTDRKSTQILVKSVQEVPLDVFAKLEEGDVLFIDSSHVAKVGSDVSFLMLRVLPRLAPGVWVHVHDIFYPTTYPSSWLKEGRAWNEGLFLRAYLLGNTKIEIVAFNSFAGKAFPNLFKAVLPSFVENSGGSIWLRTKP